MKSNIIWTLIEETESTVDEIPQVLKSIKLGFKACNYYLLDRLKEAFDIFRFNTIGCEATSEFAPVRIETEESEVPTEANPKVFEGTFAGAQAFTYDIEP